MREANGEFSYADERYGFRWGPVRIYRLISDPELGVCLELTTEGQRLQIRVTPSGRFRVGAVEHKRKGESWNNLFDTRIRK